MDDANFDPNDLLHPAHAFGDPTEVVKDPDLTLSEKRAILASWASDVFATKATLELRPHARGEPVVFDDIMEALRTLDRQANVDRYRKILHRRRVFQRKDRGVERQVNS
jgi:hypothetical protein